MSVASRAKAALAKLEGANLEKLKRRVKPSDEVWKQYLHFLALKAGPATRRRPVRGPVHFQRPGHQGT